jgi:hypothetical protein
LDLALAAGTIADIIIDKIGWEELLFPRLEQSRRGFFFTQKPIGLI